MPIGLTDRDTAQEGRNPMHIDLTTAASELEDLHEAGHIDDDDMQRCLNVLEDAVTDATASFDIEQLTLRQYFIDSEAEIPGGSPDMPSSHVEHVTADGSDYIVLSNIRGTLGVYDVTTGAPVAVDAYDWDDIIETVAW